MADPVLVADDEPHAPWPKAPWPKVPWVESDLLQKRLDSVGADEALRRFANDLSENGAAIIDLSDGPTLQLFDDAVRETDPYFRKGVARVQDAWRRSEAVRRLATLPKVLAFLEAAYGRSPFPFQTLNFKHGSQQELHSDAFHFHSEPERFMCGVWFALEDVRAEAGPLIYRRGSHRLPVLTPSALGLDGGRPSPSALRRYGPALTAQVDAAGAVPTSALLKKGEAVVWAANLAHGGAPIIDPSSTRRSLVVHYYFDNCLYHTPLRGSADGKRPSVRLPFHVETGGWVWPRKDGRRVAVRRRTLAVAIALRLLNRPLTFRN